MTAFSLALAGPSIILTAFPVGGHSGSGASPGCRWVKVGVNAAQSITGRNHSVFQYTSTHLYSDLKFNCHIHKDFPIFETCSNKKQNT